MKNIIHGFIIVCFVSLISNVSAAPFNTLSFQSGDSTGLTLKKKSATGFSAVSALSFANLSEIRSDRGPFVGLGIPGYSAGSGKIGQPVLPELSELIEIPQNATVSIVIHDVNEEVVDLDTRAGGLKITPRQPPRVKNTKKQVFQFDSGAYTKNDYGSEARVSVEILGNMRGVRIARLTVRPFRYNPGQNSLKACTRLNFSVVFNKGDMALTKRTRAKYHSPAFDAVYSRLLNYPVTDSAKDAIITGKRSYPLTYVVVASEDFLDSASLKEFIQWKRTSGFHVIEANTNDIFYSQISQPSEESKRNKLKDYLKNLYETGTYPPSYVLFVGDVADIPAFPGVEAVSTADHPHVTDLYYCTVDSEYIPYAYYGRFPAHTLDQLNSIISKTLTYEKYTMASGAYLDNAMVIAGADSSFSPIHANGQVAYLINEYLNTGTGFSEIYAYLYNETWSWAGVTTNTTGASLVTAGIVSRINSGVGIVNYTGHCDTDGWYNNISGTHELESSDIGSLSNSDRYGFMVANCCESSRFEQEDSFGENLVLAVNKGAVAYIGASNETYWDEDFYWAVGYRSGLALYDTIRDIAYEDTDYGNFDALWHNHGEAENLWYTTAGQMVYSGNLSVAQSSGFGNVGQYYFEVYNVLGDPSLMPYLGEPSPIPAPTVGGSSTITIAPCDVTGITVTTVPHVVVALNRNGVLAASANSGSSGSANLTFTPFETADTAQLVITGQNRQTTYADVTIGPPPGSIPTVFFSASTVDATSGMPVTFTSTSTGCPQTFSWIFEGGEPATSSERNPTVTFNSLGDFSVQLTVTNDIGDGVLIKNDYIHVSPLIAFTADRTTLLNGEAVTFTDNSSNSPTAWFWTFEGGEPATSTEENPTVTYSGLGYFSVSLRVTIEGMEYTLTKDNYIRSATAAATGGSGGGGGCFILSAE